MEQQRINEKIKTNLRHLHILHMKQEKSFINYNKIPVVQHN